MKIIAFLLGIIAQVCYLYTIKQSKMKTYSSKYGKVEITKETETHVTFVTDEGEEKTLLIAFANLITKDEYLVSCADFADESEAERSESERIIREGIEATYQLEEINRKGSMEQRGSSMR